MSLRRALADARTRLDDGGIEDAGMEAEVLLRHALGVSRAHLYAHLDEPMPAKAASAFESYLQRRLGHEPAAYITGRREFCGLDLAVTPATLIPRPETETLVDAVLDLVRRRPAERGKGWTEAAFDSFDEGSAPLQRPAPNHPAPPAGEGLTLADIGTGSGAIAIALARALPGARIIATDTSAAALAVAASNARRHGVEERISFREGDLASPLDGPADIVVANLPYVTTADYLALPPEIRDYEPRGALDGGPDGLDVIRQLIEAAPGLLRPQGALCLEFGVGQAEALAALARQRFPDALIEVIQDLAGKARVLVVQLTAG